MISFLFSYNQRLYFLIKHVPLAVIRKPIPSLLEVGESSAWLGVVPMVAKYLKSGSPRLWSKW